MKEKMMKLLVMFFDGSVSQDDYDIAFNTLANEVAQKYDLPELIATEVINEMLNEMLNQVEETS